MKKMLGIQVTIIMVSLLVLSNEGLARTYSRSLLNRSRNDIPRKNHRPQSSTIRNLRDVINKHYGDKPTEYKPYNQYEHVDRNKLREELRREEAKIRAYEQREQRKKDRIDRIDRYFNPFRLINDLRNKLFK